jgi:hypothetical protein
MNTGSELVRLEEPVAPKGSDMLRLAAALTALGIPLDPNVGLAWYREQTDAGVRDTTSVALEGISADRKFNAGALAKAWNDDAWHAANPTHPLAYIRTAFRNLDKMLRFVAEEQGPLALIRRGNRTAVISKRTTPEVRAKIMQGLNA